MFDAESDVLSPSHVPKRQRATVSIASTRISDDRVESVDNSEPNGKTALGEKFLSNTVRLDIYAT
jgi:hypothetical protein